MRVCLSQGVGGSKLNAAGIVGNACLWAPVSGGGGVGTEPPHVGINSYGRKSAEIGKKKTESPECSSSE